MGFSFAVGHLVRILRRWRWCGFGGFGGLQSVLAVLCFFDWVIVSLCVRVLEFCCWDELRFRLLRGSSLEG